MVKYENANRISVVKVNTDALPVHKQPTPTTATVSTPHVSVTGYSCKMFGKLLDSFDAGDNAQISLRLEAKDGYVFAEDVTAEDVSEILWGASVSAATVSNLNDKAFESVERWRSRPLTRSYPYVYVDGIYLKRAWGGAYENVSVMVAIGVNDDGYREVIGAAEGFTESADCWRDFLSWLKSRGPKAASDRPPPYVSL